MALLLTRPVLGVLATFALRTVAAHSHGDGACNGSCDEPALQYNCLMQKDFIRSRTAAPSASPSSLAAEEETFTGTGIVEVDERSAENPTGVVMSIRLSSELQESAPQQHELDEPSSLMQVISTDRLGAETPEAVSATFAALVQDPVTLDDLEIMMGAKPQSEAPQAFSSTEPEELVAWTKSSPGPNSVLAQTIKAENPAGVVVDIRLNSELQEAAAKVIKDRSSLMQVLTPDAPDTDAPQAALSVAPEELVASKAKGSVGSNATVAQASSTQNPTGIVVDVRLNSELQESVPQSSAAPHSAEAGAASAEIPIDVDASALMQVISPDEQETEAPQGASAAVPEELVAWEAQSSSSSGTMDAQSASPKYPAGTVVDIRLNSELQESPPQHPRKEPLSLLQSFTSESWGWLQALHMSREARRHREPTGTLTEAMILGLGFVIVGLVGAAVLGLMIRLLMRGCEKKDDAAAARRPLAA